MLFSRSTGGFYTPDIHKVIPPDAIEIPDPLYEQTKGQQITVDEQGMPCLHTSSPPPYRMRFKRNGRKK